jgi:hypothetical protein
MIPVRPIAEKKVFSVEDCAYHKVDKDRCWGVVIPCVDICTGKKKGNLVLAACQGHAEMLDGHDYVRQGYSSLPQETTG